MGYSPSAINSSSLHPKIAFSNAASLMPKITFFSLRIFFTSSTVYLGGYFLLTSSTDKAKLINDALSLSLYSISGKYSILTYAFILSSDINIFISLLASDFSRV